MARPEGARHFVCILRTADATRVCEDHADRDKDRNDRPYPLDDCLCLLMKQ